MTVAEHESGWAALVVVAGWSALAIVVVMGITIAVSRRLGRVSVVDVSWGLLFVAVAWTMVAVGDGGGRSWLLAALVTIWGGRLAWHIGRRSRGKGEDPRYVALLAPAPPGREFAYALRSVFAVQAVIAWFVSLPLQVAATRNVPLSSYAAVGVALWALGVAFEAIGDRQLVAFKANPAHRGLIMDRGLWAWTRHPNYFGDACVWFGLWLIATGVPAAWLTVGSPLAMTYLLVFTSGARLLEATMSSRPGYTEYRARTSGFIPRPPRRVVS